MKEIEQTSGLKPPKLRCGTCDYEIEMKWQFCPHCGRMLSEKGAAIRQEQK